MKKAALIATIAITFSSCASLPDKERTLEGVTITTDFETANLAEVKKSDQGFTLFITPEDTPINDSPWYAFDLIGAKDKAVHITLSYKDGTHRYSPKIQMSNGEWGQAVETVEVSEDERTAEFIVTPHSKTVRIAAQPIMDTQDHLEWSQNMAALDYVSLTNIGQSVEGRKIYKLEEVDAPTIKKPYVVLVGRQHPPEVTGAQALQPFVETVWGDSALAKRFREKFNLLVIPLLNPDGVARGHWRHNVSGRDLNRDWGPFTQLETQAAEREFERFKSNNDEIVLFLDFHSTWRNLIYTQLDSEPTEPVDFTRNWINNVKASLDDEVYSFTREDRLTTDRPVAKNYMYRSYGIPAMTFEVGDETPLVATESAARIFAEEMMKLLLENPS